MAVISSWPEAAVAIAGILGGTIVLSVFFWKFL